MKSRSPTFEGFRLMLSLPAFGFAEILWRWSFGSGVVALVAFSFLEYLDTLKVTAADQFLLKTRHPALISQAIRNIFHGSGSRVIAAGVILTTLLGVGWMVMASLARAATLKSLLVHFRQNDNSRKNESTLPWRMSSLFGLNGLRLTATLAAALSCFGALLLGGAAARSDNAGPGAALLIVFSAVMLACLAWSALNWFLSLAAVFVVARGEGTFGALRAAVSLCRTRPGAVFAVGIWFGIAHIVALFVATSVVAVPLSLATLLPAGVILGGVMLVTLLYFAIVDFLYIGRLAGYVAILELPETPIVLAKPESPLDDSQRSAIGGTVSRVDPDELILSDVPV